MLSSKFLVLIIMVLAIAEPISRADVTTRGAESRQILLRQIEAAAGIKSPEDWYQFRAKAWTQQFPQIHSLFRGSSLEMARTSYPNYTFLEWKFQNVSPGFWLIADNRNRFVRWFADEVSLRQPEDWYNVTTEAVEKKFGSRLLRYMNIQEMAQAIYPDFDFLPWMFPVIPTGYWDRLEHRQRYLLWLGRRLGFKSPQDWYQIDLTTIKANHGARLAQKYNRGYLIEDLQTLFPGTTFHPWRFAGSSSGYWSEPENRRNFLKHIEGELGIQSPEGWYSVAPQSIPEEEQSIARHNFGSPSKMAKELYPEFEFLDWKFTTVPMGFWTKNENQVKYLKWLGAKLGFYRPEDWYLLTKRDIISNFGYSLDRAQIIDLARLVNPDYEFLPWLFSKVPAGFWDKKDNRIAYLKWLGNKLGFRHPEDWYGLTYQLLLDNHGASLATNLSGRGWSSFRDVLKELFPDYDFKSENFIVVPAGYWATPQNRRTFLKRIESEAGIQSPEGWYNFEPKKWENASDRSAIGAWFGSSARVMAMELYPDFEFEEWKFNLAPDGFWKDRLNRLRYLHWLADQMNWRSPEDWYLLNQEQLKDHYGSGLLGSFSTYDLAREMYPNFSFVPWKFTRVPSEFWDSRMNRLAYLDWLASKLNLNSLDDWYDVSRENFSENFGGGLLGRYNSSIVDVVKELYPNAIPWKFKRVGNQFWQSADNRIAYLKWLEQRLGFKSMQDWFSVRRTDFRENDGGGLLVSQAGKSVWDLVREVHPEFPETPWLGRSVPNNYWQDEGNRLAYMRWLQKRLGFQTPEDWYALTNQILNVNFGATLAAAFGVEQLARELNPEFDFDSLRFGRIGAGQRALFQLVRTIFPNFEVQSNIRGAEGLRFTRSGFGMEIDVYVPELKLGFEYQGIQHYQSIAAWGGEAGLKDVQRRDQEKRDAATPAGIDLIEVPYWFELNEYNLRQLIRERVAKLPSHDCEFLLRGQTP